MEKNEVLIERERCKRIVARKVNAVIINRQKNIRSVKRRATSVFRKLIGDILFSIDNPDYIRKN